MANDDVPAKDGRRIDSRVVVGIVVLVVLLVFVFQNTEETPLHFLFFDFSAPLWLMLGLTVLLSLGVGYLLGRRRRRTD